MAERFIPPPSERGAALLTVLLLVAVMAVMMFHFGQGWIPGGFIGVDVFFVLSGFLQRKGSRPPVSRICCSAMRRN